MSEANFITSNRSRLLLHSAASCPSPTLRPAASISGTRATPLPSFALDEGWCEIWVPVSRISAISVADFVVISLLGMLLLGVAFVVGLALGAIAAVVLVMAGSLTLLPALLGFTGRTLSVVLILTIRDGRIQALHGIGDPRKLGLLSAQLG